MKKVGSRELKNRLGKYLARVRKGERIVVTDRGNPVAQLIPLPPDPPPTRTLDDVLQELAAQGHLTLPKTPTEPRPPFIPIKVKGKLASRMIIEDRE